MAADQLKLLARFYYSPRKAAGEVLDRGNFVFALIAALLVAVALTLASAASYYQSYSQLVERYTAEFVAGQTRNAPVRPPQLPEADGVDQAEALSRRAYGAIHARATQELDRLYFASSWRSLALIAVLFVPACLIIATKVAHLGAASTVIFRDYMPLLVNCLFAWTASHLPIAVFWYSGVLSSPQAIAYSQWAGLAAYLSFSACCLMSVLGLSFSKGLGVAVGGLAVSAVGGWFFAASSGGFYMFLAPWLLFYGYRMFAGDVRALGGGLAARQNFKRQLEAATLNPRDADAHFQLGLIYLQRRNSTDAEACFRRALEIDPDEDTALFELGKLLRESGRLEEAHDRLARGAKLNDRLSNHEVWRELGAVALAAGRQAEGLAHLEKYVARREYDAEGLVLYGKALKAAGRGAEARSAFEQAITAVKTAPTFRRHELKKFEREAEIEIRTG